MVYLYDVSVILSLSEESENVSITILLVCTDFSLCSTTRLHYVQNDRDLNV